MLVLFALFVRLVLVFLFFAQDGVALAEHGGDGVLRWAVLQHVHVSLTPPGTHI